MKLKTNRAITREKAMTILYQLFLYNKNNITYDLADIITEVIADTDSNEKTKIDSPFLKDIINGVINNQKDIDIYIRKYMTNWDIERSGPTDQAIIRIAVYELVYTDTPNLVCINEAIEIAKKYSDDKVVKMINGVLDKIYHEEEENG